MLAASLALSGLLAGPIQTSVTTWLVLDPSSENRLELDVPAELGGPSGTPLVGGVLATLHFDLVKVLLNQPLAVDVEVEEIRIAGESFAALKNLPVQTGTICVAADPGQPGTGTVTLPLLGLPHIEAEMRTVSFPTALPTLFPDGIALGARIDDDMEIDLRALLLNGFTSGPVAVDTQAEGVVPSDVLLLGGLPFRLRVKILNSLQPPTHPLLDECAAFFAAR